ncbi:uncharacterized protein LOC108700137 [Xenopus laevis]|uniref:Uncharacterized protein LOC108700137 n=2 Tax=Xenopus laevis TaxID=8355 RepID=A0A1L8F2Z0_XENLA|nr:uncharacterized protein LOC108700137 [Xenopus laevis]OCT65957.1 hypothetical protein XELAEV_18042211mg [Xenopus laevis]
MSVRVFSSFLWNIWTKIVQMCSALVAAFGDWAWEDEGKGQPVEEEKKQVTRQQTAQKHEDTVDVGIGDNFRKALETVSETIYSLYISPWYNAPEEMKDQLLYKELSNAIQNTYVKAQKKTHHIEGYEIIITIANILTDHLKSFRKLRRNCREMMRKEELDIIRHHTNALLCCLLPDSLTESKHVMVFLNEILAVNVLEPTINTMADPNFINQQIITSLESAENGTDGHCDETPEHLKRASATSNTLECQQLQYSQQNGIKKTKLNKVKGAFKRLFKKSPRSFGNDTCSMYKSWNTEQQDPRTSVECFDTIDGPLCIEESDNLFSKWKKEDWIARISLVRDGIYHICVLQRDYMQTEAWNVKRSTEDFIQVHSILSQRHPREVPASSISEESWKSNKQFVADFVDKLVKLTKENNDSKAAFFLSPFKYTEEDENLFHAIFIDKVATEEELQDSSLSHSSIESLDDDSSETDGSSFKMLTLRKRNKDKKSSVMNNEEKNEGSECSSEVMLTYIKEASKSTGPVKWKSYSSSRPGQQDEQVRAGNLAAERKKSLRKELFTCLCRLADEMLAGGHHLFTCLNSCGTLKTYEETACQLVTWLFEEEQMVGYLNKLSDMMKNSEDMPQQQIQLADIIQKQALEQIKEKLMSFTYDSRIYRFFVQHSDKYIQMPLDALQDPIANKYALFRLLKELTEYITEEPKDPA